MHNESIKRCLRVQVVIIAEVFQSFAVVFLWDKFFRIQQERLHSQKVVIQKTESRVSMFELLCNLPRLGS